MRTGTKSLLFGVHQFAVHPVFVLVAWWRIFGRPGWEECVAIIVHDWGYWGSPKMDDGYGRLHPQRMARRLRKMGLDKAADEVLFHSRFTADKARCSPSRLCYADKVASAMMPIWLWILSTWLSGELAEYLGGENYEIRTNKRGVTAAVEFFKKHRALVKRILQEAPYPLCWFFARRWLPGVEPFDGELLTRSHKGS